MTTTLAREERDEVYWAELFDSQREQFRRDLRIMARQMDPLEFEDLEQEAWLKIWRNIHKWDCDRSFKNWALRVLTNVHIDRLRRFETRMKNEVCVLSELRAPNDVLEFDIRDDSTDLEGDLLRADQDKQLRKLLGCVDNLEQRKTVELVLFEGEDYKEVCTALNKEFESDVDFNLVRQRAHYWKHSFAKKAIARGLIFAN